MSFYDILGVPNNAQIADIKKAYRQLVLKYHPDKNNNIDAPDKFREIQVAYEVLSDEVSRKEYDNMTESEQYEIYTYLKNYLYNISPKYGEIFDMVGKYLYTNEQDLRNDINTCNFKNIYDKIRNQIRRKGTSIKVDSINDKIDNDKSDNDMVDVDSSASNYFDFIPINECDLLIVKYISLSQYLYGSSIDIVLPTDETVTVEFPSFIDSVPIQKIANMGLTKNDKNDKNDKGDLYVYFKIDGINTLCITEIDNAYAESVKELITTIFT